MIFKKCLAEIERFFSNHRHTRAILVILSLLFLKLAQATPQTIRVDGSLFDSSGNALSGVTTSVQISAYTAATGGSSLWTSNSYSVVPSNGRFSVSLDTSANGGLLSQIASLGSGAALWFEVSYNSTVVRPRFKARGTMYALSAASADALQAIPVSTATPAANNVLSYNGSQWTPATLASLATGLYVNKGGDSMSGVLSVGTNVYANGFTVFNQTTPGTLALGDTSTRFVSLRAPTALGSNWYFTLPPNAGSNGNYLATDGQGALSWVPPPALTTNALSGTGSISVSGGGLIVGSATTISVATASASSNGILNQTDWNTFNGKQNALGYVPVNKAGDTMTGALTINATLMAATVNISGAGMAGVALVTDGSGNIIASPTTTTELGYIHGVTNVIQTQLNSIYGSILGTSASPGAFSFTNQTGVNLNTLIASNAVTLSGVTGVVYASCNGCTAIVRNGVAGTVSSAFLPGDNIALQVVSSSSTLSSVTASVTVGTTVSGPWTVATGTAVATTPNPFSFLNQTGVIPGTVIISNAVQVNGFTGSVSATCGSGCTNIAINGVWGVTTGIIAGNMIAIQQTSSGSTSTQTSASVTVGSTSSGAWNVITNSSSDPCANSPTPGTTCLDGTVYAGISPDGNVPMYTLPCDSGQTLSNGWCTGNKAPQTWNNGSASSVATGTTSNVTGKASSATLVGLGNSPAPAPYVAAQYCASLTSFGHSDWYLPALNELNILYVNNVAIGGFGGMSYWSSTEQGVSPGNSFFQNFLTGAQDWHNSKAAALPIRCVRR